ncbi:MAG TPA: CHASE3 domain-containing protein [Verrucomicrobiae bacterium]|nr:CHASE3 domain-containing protein [Verrucomicrobiae bacterium]
MALGTLVIIGWFAHWTTVIQVLPSLPPMKFNTALCLTCCGASLMFLYFERRLFVLCSAAVPAAISLLTWLEYLTGEHLGIDQLLIKDYVRTATAFPGRMSPLAATCFLLLSIALILASREWRKNQALTAAGLLSCIVGVIATVGLFGYLMGIEAAYGWGAYTRMALHTAICFLALSTGLLAWSYEAAKKTGFNFLRWLPVTGSLTLMIMIAFVSVISFAQLKIALGWRKHSYEVLTTAQTFLADLFSSQRGMRNFVLTSQPVARDAYESGISNAPAHLAELVTLTRDNPSQQSRLKTLKTDLDELSGYSKELIEIRNTAGLETAIQTEANGQGFEVINRTVRDLQLFTDEEKKLSEERNTSAEANFRNTAVLLVFGSVLAAGLLVFANWMVNREMRRRRRAEQMQARLAMELKGLIESSGEGIYGIDVRGCCTFINAAGARAIGYDLYEVLGKNMHDLTHHSRADGSRYPVEECPIFLSFKSDLSCRVDSEVFWRKDGSSFMVEYTSFPIVEESVIKGAVVTFADISERRRHETERENLIAELQQALVEVKTLSGLIPICGWCKKVRSDTGFWQNVEQYIRSRTDATFSHGICPDCADKFKVDVARVNTPKLGS